MGCPARPVERILGTEEHFNEIDEYLSTIAE